MYHIKAPLKMCILLFLVFFNFSCSKDADLISDYVINGNDLESIALLADDRYFIGSGQDNILMDVLNNDNIIGDAKVTITETSIPNNGEVVINADNTLTYTRQQNAEPETSKPEETSTTEEPEEEPVEDTFTYTTEVTAPDNTVLREEATVTVTDTNSKLPVSGNNVFYVTTEGKSSNNGKTESTAWDITHAFKAAKAGDYIHIKAGNYGNKNLVVQNSGTTNQPIRFTGYSNAPGDVVSFEGSTFNYGDNLDASKMPLLQGSRTNNEGKGEGIVITNSYIEISNIQIKYFEKGLRSSGDYNVLDNIVVADVGDFNPSHSKENSGNAFLNYNGVGIIAEGKNVVLKNSVVVNAGAEGIHTRRGSNQVHSHNSVYSDNPTNPTDYYYLLSSASHHNEISNAMVYRKNGLSHYGHGIVLKGDAKNNTFKNFEIFNTVLELSFSHITENLLEDGIITGSYNRDVQFHNHVGGILVANGAHHNTLRNIKISKVEAIISFADWRDGTNSPLDLNDAGNNNTFVDIIGKDAAIAINFDEFRKLEGVAHNNLFKNCTFKNIDRLFHVNRPNAHNVFEDCTFENIDSLQSTSSGYDYLLNPNTTFINFTAKNLSFTLP